MGRVPPSAQAPPSPSGSPLHRRLRNRSILHTLAFYGTVLVLCVLVPLFVTGFIAIFFLRFYRREIADFLKHPLRGLRLARGAESPVRMEVLPPGEFPRA